MDTALSPDWHYGWRMPAPWRTCGWMFGAYWDIEESPVHDAMFAGYYGA